MRDITLVDGLPTRLLVKFEDADAAQGKNPRPPGSHAWADLKARGFLRHITSCYLRKVPTQTIQIPGYWDFGFVLTFTSTHAFTTYLKINMEKMSMTGIGCGRSPGHLGMAHVLGFH
jgi:hypothetical protein